MNIDAFFRAYADEADAHLGTVTMTCAGQTFPVVWAGARKSLEGELGGLESDVVATATAQFRHVSEPNAMLQKRCTIDGEAYRIRDVLADGAHVVFQLSDPSDTR